MSKNDNTLLLTPFMPQKALGTERNDKIGGVSGVSGVSALRSYGPDGRFSGVYCMLNTKTPP
jgi:hypothetical protein